MPSILLWQNPSDRVWYRYGGSQAADDRLQHVILFSRALLTSICRMNAFVDEGQLVDDCGRQHKRIKVLLSHASVQGIDRKGQREPSRDQAVQITFVVRVEVDDNSQLRT